MISGFDAVSCDYKPILVCGIKLGSAFTIFFIEADGTIEVAGFGVPATLADGF